MLQKLSERLFVYEDTCRVYVVRCGDAAVLVDFGSGDVLDRLEDIGVSRVTDVLMTHHHRDQGQGLARAARAGARIWVPHQEQELFADADARWQARELYNNYNMRQDRFSLLEQVEIAGTLKDYSRHEFGGDVAFTVVPTPGHTIGSVTLVAELDGKRQAFVGDLLAAPGKLWSIAATQWSYNGAEGLPATVSSLLELAERYAPQRLLPSHGEPIDDVEGAVALTVERLTALMRARGQNPRLFMHRDQPYEPITPHLLRSRQSFANYYVLLSESGKALLFDFGYDFHTGYPSGSDRASRRPTLYSIPRLKEQYGVSTIDVALPTHFHDDHVAGFNLLRDVEGTRVWAAASFADILRTPGAYDLPCLWYDPIPVDRELPLETPVQWEEYELTLHPLPGHTLYAVGISLEVDGKRVLVAGDQYQGKSWNYVYPNRFRIHDYVDSAALFRRLNPELILSGHSDPYWVEIGYLDELERSGRLLEQLHRDLLPLEDVNLGAEGFAARIEPYQAEGTAGEPIAFMAELLNPFTEEAVAEVRVILPDAWACEPQAAAIRLGPNTAEAGSRPAGPVRQPAVAGSFRLADDPHSADTKADVSHPADPYPSPTGVIRFRVTAPPGTRARRARIAVDVTINNQRFGQQAEALITIRDGTSPDLDVEK